MSERIDLWKQQVEEDPGNELSRFSLAQAYFEARDYGNALDQYEAALSAKPEWMMAAIQRGHCLLRLGRTEDAKAAFRRGLELAISQDHKGPREEMEDMLAELGG